MDAKVDRKRNKSKQERTPRQKERFRKREHTYYSLSLCLSTIGRCCVNHTDTRRYVKAPTKLSQRAFQPASLRASQQASQPGESEGDVDDGQVAVRRLPNSGVAPRDVSTHGPTITRATPRFVSPIRARGVERHDERNSFQQDAAARVPNNFTRAALGAVSIRLWGQLHCVS